MKEIESEGKTVTHAVEKGLADLGLRRDQVEVEVLQEAVPGFLGLGAKPARVRIREKIWGELPAGETRAPAKQAHKNLSTTTGPAQSIGQAQKPVALERRHEPRSARADGTPTHRHGGSGERPAARPPHIQPAARPAARTGPSPVHEAPPDTEKACAETKVVLDELMRLMRIEHPDVIVSWDAKQVRVRAELETPDTQVLLGKEGATLESLQFLTTLMLSRRMKTPVAVQVDCGNYWQAREETVIEQVHQAMEMVKRTNRAVRLKPMDACMRRLVHRALAGNPEFETASEGEGSWRKVVLKPRAHTQQ